MRNRDGMKNFTEICLSMHCQFVINLISVRSHIGFELFRLKPLNST